MERKANLLLAEDDDHLRELLREGLEEAGYNVTACADGKAAIDAFDKNVHDICLLDIMMPLKDGYVVAQKIRQQSDLVPVLFLSTKSQIDDKLAGYQKGGDDYIVKPFNMKELLMKLDVFVRRTRKMFSERKEEYRLGSVLFEYNDLRLTTAEGSFKLRQREADLLRFLCLHQNKVIRREEVLLAVWGKDDFFLGRSMDVFMSKLRKYLKADSSVSLETIHGVGYRVVV